MVDISIVPSTREHVTELCLTLRDKEKEEALGLGLDPVEGAYYANDNAVYRRTILLDDEVAARNDWSTLPYY